jgi:hypothetical protein
VLEPALQDRQRLLDFKPDVEHQGGGVDADGDVLVFERLEQSFARALAHTLQGVKGLVA